ncbi:M28 family peptidase [Sphingomonas sp. CGMCC 1.13654]|uniref:M28 family peptidase n=1 Tax=Sphingomonas chungangi TaxID=2683589 RepID=A0A838L7Y9_9SPHN|nr:M28 family metallopeptidase [Sphingomonas chungangi]MBA2935020.1 M28 family peptidase [Sphingomonas chungangi]MVW54135.1 M28 family peptidase [Sphingomonas chungangi]
MRFMLACLLAALPARVLAITPPEPLFSPQRLSGHIRTLSSDAFEGRGPATAGETKTLAYLIQQFQAAGLQPGGPLKNGKRGWTQDVPLLRSEIVGQPDIAMDIAGAKTPLVQGNEIAIRAPMDGEKTIAIDNAPLIFVGYGVKAPERNWDDFKGVDLHGKIMVVLVNDPDYETGQGDFGGKAMTYYGRWTYKYEEGARQGAAGVIVIHETDPASYGWATVKNSNTNPQFDIVRKDPKASHTAMEAWIQRDLAVKLFQTSGLDFEALKKQAQTRDFKPVELKATMSAAYTANVSTITSHNVLARLPGTKHPGETVMYTAHWDHLGVGAPDAKGDRIYNGAVDNGTGQAALLELARAFASLPRTDRSLVFMAVTAEEKGLLGSEFYATNPVYPLATTAGVINMDALSVTGPTKDFTISGTAKLGLLDDLIAEGRKQGRSYTPDPRVEAGGFYRSDHFSMAKRGVPAISFGSGRDLVNGGREKGDALAKDYTANRYHQPGDEWSADWDLSGMAQDVGLLYDLGRDLANSREWPNWSEDSEFRAERDKTAAERR